MATKYPRKIKKIAFFIDEAMYNQFLLKVTSEGYSMQKVLQLLVDRYTNEELPYFEKSCKNVKVG